MTQAQPDTHPSIDTPTLAGIVLFLTPLLTMVHELGGHALVCVATGHVPTALGAYYVECPGAHGLDARLVAMAGTSMDVLVFAVAWLAWRHVRQDLPRLLLWIVFTVKGMVAAGYWLFSGVAGLGDWAPGTHGGMGAMAHPWIWRGALVAVGLLAYVAVTRLSMRSLDAMLGSRGAALAARRKVAMTVYLVGGGVALVVGLFNPIGIVITLVSAVASSFGGTAGLFNVAFRAPGTLPAQSFRLDRDLRWLVAGLLVVLAFAIVLGPTLHPGAA